jgi:CheY-like chemotaxis protein
VERSQGEKPTIVVIDDEAVVARSLERVLVRAGFAVRVATDGTRGLQLIADEKPDLVITDNNMPGITGAEVIKSLRSQPATADLRILMVTASNPKTPPEFSPDEVMTKPFDSQELVATIRRLISGRR